MVDIRAQYVSRSKNTAEEHLQEEYALGMWKSN
jgi:hypothetical protein